MPTVSVHRLIRQISADFDGSRTRFDLALDVQAPDGSPVLSVGAIWDGETREYNERPPEPHRVKLVTSQLQAALQLSAWFLAYERGDPDRQALEMYVDNRRGGKTFFVCLAILLFCIKYPRCHLGKTVCWIVVPTYPQQREIHEDLAHVIPAAWFSDGRIKYHKSDKYYSLANGAEIWIKSADRPQSLKAGKVAAVALNEAQQMDAKAALNAIGANIDTGGICFLALNPVDSVKGLWLENVHDAINGVDPQGNPLLPFARETPFPAAQNEVIDQMARTRFGKIAAVIDPKQAQRDALGLWVAIKDKAYPFYDRSVHFRPDPTLKGGWVDFTLEANNVTNLLDKGDSRSWGAGMDFQRRPWCAFITAKVYKAPAGLDWVKAGAIVYVVKQEVCNDVSVGDHWTEELLCLKIAERMKQWGTNPKKYLLVADRTGKQQGASGRQRGHEADPETYSWPIVEGYGWQPHAPIEMQQIVKRDKQPSKIDRVQSNPLVSVRLNVTNEVLRDHRLIICSEAQTTAESFRLCEVRKDSRKPFGDSSHLTDSVGYLIFAWETALRAAGIVKVPQ